MRKKDNALAREMMARHNYALARLREMDAMRAYEDNRDPARHEALHARMMKAVKAADKAWNAAHRLGLVLQ